jgi:hypothetical protein
MVLSMMAFLDYGHTSASADECANWQHACGTAIELPSLTGLSALLLGLQLTIWILDLCIYDISTFTVLEINNGCSLVPGRMLLQKHVLSFQLIHVTMAP